ncbi:AAA family ATPase [Mycolicibacterium fortuitum]|uniref:AAA family ATPase n=1 Tax=Mycolicibacterium fortuitum TaxID=1766 RepID=UPI0034CEE429
MTDDEDRPQLTLTRLSDVKPERLEWLWRGWLPKGKIVTLDGDPGLGKSTAALDIAATITTGGTWPDGTRCEHPGGVLLLSAEDGLADTVRPRLDAAGADVSRVHAIEGKSYFDPESGQRYLRPLTLANVTDLGDAMATTGARGLIVDVLMAFMPAGTDSHKDQDIRRVLSALAAAADANDCTVLLLRHLNKAKGGDPLYRGGGSIGIVGAARSGLLVAADPDDPSRRVLASVKSNLGVTPASLAYRLVDSPDHGVARVEWEGVSNLDAHSLLSTPRDDDPDAKNSRRDVDDWLGKLLADGPVESNTVYEAADAAGFSKDKAKRAKGRMKVEAYRETGDGPWLWRLPTKGADDQGSAQDSQNLAPLLPCTSDGVQNGEIDQGSKRANDCTLGSADQPTDPIEEPVTTPRPTICKRCYVALPVAATNSLCDECDGAPEPAPAPKPTPQPELHVVHNGALSKRNGGLESIRYYTTAPNGLPPQQTPKETA